MKRESHVYVSVREDTHFDSRCKITVDATRRTGLRYHTFDLPLVFFSSGEFLKILFDCV